MGLTALPGTKKGQRSGLIKQETKRDMKQNKNIFPSLSIAAALLIATMFASCTKAELEVPVVKQDAEISFGLSGWNTPSKIATKGFAQSESKVLVKHNPDDPGSLGLSVTVVDGIDVPKSQIPVTKGHHITDIEEFDVASYYYTQSPSFDANYIPWQEYNNGFSNGKSYFWPSTGSMYFVARYPTKTTTYKVGENDVNVFSEDIYTNNDGNLQFSYTIPASVENQRDIMAAVEHVADNNAHAGTPVNLKFQHLLAAVQFKVGDMQFIKINSISISGIKGDNVRFEYKNGEWITATLTGDLTYNLSLASGTLADTEGLPKGSDITGNETNSMIFVAPQQTDGVSIVVDYVELLTGESTTATAHLPKTNWVAGKTAIYSLNIGTTFNVTIPTPQDQDAHYVMLEMDYDIGAFNELRLSNIKATARFLEDGTNTSTKSGISLRFDRTETQKQGYWSDELWELKYRINRDGSTTPANPTPIFKEKIRGSDELTITRANSAGKIYLFLEENNGWTDRNGELNITAQLPNGNPITLGKGSFKQLCPSWNSSNVGVERFEDTSTYPYGFNYTRKVVYTNDDLDLDRLDGQWYENIFYKLLVLLLGGSTDELIPDLDNAAEGFVVPTTINVWGTNVITAITLNYEALNIVSNENTSVTNGLDNTIFLYDLSGETDISDLETRLDENIGDWHKDVPVDSHIPDEYAAFAALRCNKMRELYVEISSSEGTEKLTKVLPHRAGEGNGVTPGSSIDETTDIVIEW